VIRVTVETGADGVPRSVSADGHSLAFEIGQNIVCAAATVLLRTAARLLEATDGIEVTGGAGERGRLAFSVAVLDESRIGYAKAVGDYLIQGMSDLEREFPGECALARKTGDRHGT
jgi:hypothetical protein